jgi:Carboxypeptidase regulatory-like domain
LLSRQILGGGRSAADAITGLLNTVSKKTFWLAIVLLPGLVAWCSTSGSISGTVKDPAGKVIPGAGISVRETATGAVHQAQTDSKGYYALPVLPVGRYELKVQAAGFGLYERKGIVLDTNAALTEDATLTLGGVAQTVSVSDNALHVETVSTQMGEVISSKQMTSVPLDGRSYTDLMALQPGVAPETSITADTVQDVGAVALSPSGTLNPGTLSINGRLPMSSW